jgi:outer membrane protein TolC
MKNYIYKISCGILIPALSFSLLSATAYADPITLEEAIARTLSKHTNIKISHMDVKSAEGDVRAAGGSFDLGLSGSATVGRTNEASFSTTTLLESEVVTRAQTYTVGVSQAFRNSSTLSFSNTTGTSRIAESPLETIGASEWSIGFSIPLLKGFGEEMATATEVGTIRTLDSTRLASGYTISNQAYQAAIAFWTSLQIQINHQNLTTTMQRAGDTAKTLEERQQGGELAVVELQRSMAQFRLRQVDVEEGRQGKFEAQENLALAIGNEKSDTLPEAQGNFPKPAAAAILKGLDKEKYIELAGARRLDVKAQEKLIEVAKISLKSSKNNLLPDLSLSMSAGYTSAIDGFNPGKVHSLYDDAKERNGPDYSIGFSLSYPLGNNAAAGAMSSDKAALVTEELNLELLYRTVRKDVSVAIDKLQSAAVSYKLATESLAMMKEVAEETSRKLKLGEASMTDLISVENSLATGRIKETSALSNYAKAIAELRFVTGTLASGKDENLTFNSQAFKTLPLAELAGGGIQ